MGLIVKVLPTVDKSDTKKKQHHIVGFSFFPITEKASKLPGIFFRVLTAPLLRSKV